jgi:hypothetical protein
VPIDLRPQDIQIIVRSFQAAMPHCSLWMVNNCLNKHAVLLGTLEPMQLDLKRIGALMSRSDVAEDLRGISVYSPYDFVDCAVVAGEGLRRLAGAGPLHTDDRPHLEFGVTIKRDSEACWLSVLDAIRLHHTPVSPYVTNAAATPGQTETPQAILQQYYEGTSHTLAGMVGMLQGDPDIVGLAFETARKVNPRDRDVDSILVELDGEIHALEKAVVDKPEAADLRSRLAQKYMVLRRFAQAAQQYESFLKLESGNAAAWNNLGVCRRSLGHNDRAAEAFERAVQSNPGLFAAYANLADLYEKQGDLPKAENVLRRALPLQTHTGQARVHDKLARLQFLQQRYDLAIQYLDRAMELARDDPSLWQYLSTKRQQVAAKAAGATR